MKLIEVYNRITDTKHQDFTALDDWESYTNLDYLADMGFDILDEWTMGLKNPEMRVYIKNGKLTLEEPKGNFEFPDFDNLITHFDKYQQDFKKK